MSLTVANPTKNMSCCGGVSWAFCWINEWRARARWRRSITHFTNRELDDFGLLEVQASRESSKPFWMI